MPTETLFRLIVSDEALTRGLGDIEARMLIDWLVEQAERLDAAEAEIGVRLLCRRGRAIGRFVSLWCRGGSQAAATQLAASENFAWPLPSPDVDSIDLMEQILAWESDQAD